LLSPAAPSQYVWFRRAALPRAPRARRTTSAGESEPRIVTRFNTLAKAALARLGLCVCWRDNQQRGADWMLDLTRHVRANADDQRILLDVGANIGQTSLALVGRFPTATIHAFEPVTSTFGHLRAATRAHGNITCHRTGLSDRAGTIEFEATPDSVYNSIATSDHCSPPGAPREFAPVTTIDQFIAGLGVARVDLLKTDTEGHDVNVLRGAIDSLSRGVIRAVFTEVTFCRDNPRNTYFPVVQDFLEPLGYRFVGLYDMHWFQTKRWDQSFCNALFVRDETLAPVALPARPESLRPSPGLQPQVPSQLTESMGIEV
jgi:FkbM family methyltransferase